MTIKKTQDPTGGCLTQDIENFKENSTFNEAYDREKLRGFVVAAMVLSEPIS